MVSGLEHPSPIAPLAHGYRGFLAFCRAIGEDLAPFQRTIARAIFGPEREVAVVLPRGSGKTRLAALVALHHLVTAPDASVSLGAASREQASIAFGVMREAAEHPVLAGQVEARHLALRASGGGVLRVVSGRGERAHGQTDSLMVLDELWSHPDGKLLEAFETALVKRSDSKLVVISTAASSLDSALGNLRRRALSGEVERRGAFVDARAPGLRWLEWSVPDGEPLEVANVARANPAPWITRGLLAEQRERVSPLAWAQFHACRWGVGEAAWLPPGAWAACRGECEVEEGERLWLGVDIGGSRAASAVVGVTADLRVAVVRVYEGDEAVLEVTEAVRELAGHYVLVEVAFDPWRFKSEALRLEREGLVMSDFPQSHARLTAASERLHSAVVERRLRHPGNRDLDRHVASAVAKATGRGWRLDKVAHGAQIDAVVALAMAVERAEQRPEPVQLLGWL